MAQIDIGGIDRLFSVIGDDLYNTAQDTIRVYGMNARIESGVLVGLSGGADSVMLLCLLREYKKRSNLDFPIVACHVNHGIRAAEADHDEDFCRELCELLGIELVVAKCDVPFHAKRFHMGLEEAAREVRYNEFRKIISGRNDISTLAVAHNMNDCAETVIFNVVRGSGARGAGGISPIRDNIIRPLINVSKADILSCLDRLNIPYVVDSTNLSEDYTRNYIRNSLMPSLERISSCPEKTLSRFAQIMRADEDYMRMVAENFVAEHEEIYNSDLLSLHTAIYARVIAILCERIGAGVSYRIAMDIRDLLYKDNFSYSLIGGASFVCEHGICRLSRNIGTSLDYCFAVEGEKTSLAPLNADFIISEKKFDKTFLNVYKISIQANLSSAIINGSLYLRPKKDGDTVYYGGMTHKLKKLFSDRKIPPSKRRLIPVLCDDSGVVWVPGFGVRDDGVDIEKRKDIYVLLGITSDNNTDDRMYSGSEFKS